VDVVVRHVCAGPQDPLPRKAGQLLGDEVRVCAAAGGDRRRADRVGERDQVAQEAAHGVEVGGGAGGADGALVSRDARQPQARRRAHRAHQVGRRVPVARAGAAAAGAELHEDRDTVPCQKVHCGR